MVYHVGGATLSTENPHKTFLNFRNSLLMLYKNSAEKDLNHALRVRSALDYVAAFKFFLTGHFKNALAIYRARKAFHRLLPSYENKRKENLEKRTLTQIPEVLSKSLILQFYIHGKKLFSDF